jgi:hypothetical protein
MNGGSNTEYLQKYLIYKSKYLTLKDNTTQNGGAIKFSCNPNTKFIDICRSDENGMYHSKEKCMNDCENKYINTHLIRAKLKKK